MPEIIKALMTTKADSQHHGDQEAKATEPPQRKLCGAGGQSSLWDWQPPLGLIELDNGCPAAARVGYQDEQDC